MGERLHSSGWQICAKWSSSSAAVDTMSIIPKKLRPRILIALERLSGGGWFTPSSHHHLILLLLLFIAYHEAQALLYQAPCRAIVSVPTQCLQIVIVTYIITINVFVSLSLVIFVFPSPKVNVLLIVSGFSVASVSPNYLSPTCRGVVAGLFYTAIQATTEQLSTSRARKREGHHSLQW